MQRRPGATTWLSLTLGFAALWPAGAARAGGTFIPGAGPQAQARAGAFVAKADDPTAMAHNPAGFARTHGTVLYVGANLMQFDLEYTRAGSYELSDAEHVFEGTAYPTVTNRAHPEVGLGRMQAIPTVLVATDLGMSRLPVRFGAGLYAPQSYPGRSFLREHDSGDPFDPAPGPQRYDSIDLQAAMAFPSVAVAYSATPTLAIGLRLSWGFANFDSETALPGVLNYEETPGKDSIFSASVSDRFVPSWSLGVLYRPLDSLELGLAYESAAAVHAIGNGRAVMGSELGLGMEAIEPLPASEAFACAPGGVVGAVKTCLDLEMPQLVSVGGRWIVRDAQARERGDLELDIRWENWGAQCALPEIGSLAGAERGCFDSLVTVDGRSALTTLPLQPTVIRHGFQDVLSFRLGGSYLLPLASNPLTMRAGIAYDTATAPTSWTRVDVDGAQRTTLALGLAYEVGRSRFDLGAGVVLEPRRSVAQCAPPSGPDAASPGCLGNGQETPSEERQAPDPIYALAQPDHQVENPFNAGDYWSRYVILSLGMQVRF